MFLHNLVMRPRRRVRLTEEEQEMLDQLNMEESSIVMIRGISLALNIVIVALCVYLSWTLNTSLGESTPVKVLYALVAAMFGPIYLVYYILVSADIARLTRLQGEMKSSRFSI
jgi:hypothetical protein